MTVTNVLSVIGWVFLISSWVIPYVMRRMNKNEMNISFIGGVLAAISLGVFMSDFIVSIMK